MASGTPRTISAAAGEQPQDHHADQLSQQPAPQVAGRLGQDRRQPRPHGLRCHIEKRLTIGRRIDRDEQADQSGDDDLSEHTQQTGQGATGFSDQPLRVGKQQVHQVISIGCRRRSTREQSCRPDGLLYRAQLMAQRCGEAIELLNDAEAAPHHHHRRHTKHDKDDERENDLAREGQDLAQQPGALVEKGSQNNPEKIRRRPSATDQSR